jgi:hypothetical protein
MALNSLFSQVLGAITNHTDQQNQSPNTPFNPSGLLGEIQGLFGQHAKQTGQVLDASQDPYGDPGAQNNILDASQDPYGDPANQR